MITELLQQQGFNKYEAEAYVTLARFGALTGYEVGKRSDVPLSRSYDILNRLIEKGMALVQPGEPPRYSAVPPALVVERLRADEEARLNALAAAFAGLEPAPADEGFWVARGRTAALELARAMVDQAEQDIAVRIASGLQVALDASLNAARARGCRVVIEALPARSTPDELTLVVDERVALAGELAPPDTCQVVSGRAAGFVAGLRRSFQPPLRAPAVARPGAMRLSDAQRLDWLAWEDRKQRHLLSGNGDVASA